MSSTRRRFLMVSGGAAATLLPHLRGAQPPTPPASPTVTPSPGPPPPIAGVARERYGKFLTGEEQKALDERFRNMERRSARLRSFKLGNGEEPATDFRVKR